ncbi:MAG: type III-A CRISPR-associated protein Cas10/Csm1 [Methylohalobius crimeensis]
MESADLMTATCRVALSAYLHDLGKFAERAALPFPEEKLSLHLQQYCPRHDTGRIWYSHRHAAYTALVWDRLEPHFPPVIGADVFPFAAWNAPGVDDSMINAAARHHKPETFLQWIVATADRVASGFEREEFERYNAAEEKTNTGRNNFTARQLTLFEQIRLQADEPEKKAEFHWRYPLKPMSVQSLFPVAKEGYEHNDTEKAKREYAELWGAFEKKLKSIPESHRENWPLWLDHFDSAWAAFCQAIPSATAGRTKPEVSLYDHSHTTAALAVALWRYHHEREDDQEAVRRALRTHEDWSENKFLLVLGDFFGIQDFIFASGGETQKNAAKLLRGRSFYVSLLTECAALKILDTLDLPPTSQVINAAGKFLIVAPNTEATKTKLRKVQQALNDWFLNHTYGLSGIGITWQEAACDDFLKGGQDTEPPFKQLLGRLFERQETMKAQRLNLCGEGAPHPVFEGFLNSFHTEKGVCAIDGRSPAIEKMEKTEDKYVCALAADQIRVGKWLGHHDRVLITSRSPDHHTLKLPIFDYHVSFTGGSEATGQFGSMAKEGDLVRMWDYTTPDAKEEVLFSGHARRFINAYIPPLGSLNEYHRERYKGLDYDEEPRAPKTLEHIARDALDFDKDGRSVGTAALMTLKGDVDNLGNIFQKGLEKPSFAKWAALSRQMNAFFAIYLPWLCKTHYKNTYTVFAGGDDFFLIGPWFEVIELAREMRAEFERFVGGNPEIHFSAGLVMTKPGLPVPQLGQMAEDALENAKSSGNGGKNAVTMFGHTVTWQEFELLWRRYEQIKETAADLELSTGYLYGLQTLADMREQMDANPENAIWRSWFSYRTWRQLDRTHMSKEECKRRMGQLAKVLSDPIETFGSRFKIPLFTFLYQHRTMKE